MTRELDRTSLAISPNERAYLAQKDLERFWLSRLRKKDPIARIGYALWVSDVEDLKREIATGDQDYWAHRGFRYWDLMARSTVVNISVGLERAGFRGTFGEMRAEIRKVGVEVAKLHAAYVQHDYDEKIGDVAGLLSLKQVAEYHHVAFSRFNIPPSYYGGTWFGAVPDQIQFDLYGHLYCHDCDTAEGYEGNRP